MEGRVCVIVNPAAGRGRGAKMIPEISARFGEMGVTDIRMTTSEGNESAIAAEAIRDGFGTLVVVGGDGTTSNVANSILGSGGDTVLAVMPAGTGNDFAKVLGTARSDVASVAKLVVQQTATRVDVGKIEEVYFLNCCGFGFDVAVLEEISRARWLRGNSVYLYTALAQLFRYSGIELAVRSGDSVSLPTLHMLLVIANTEYFGGMFRIAPGASVTDGLLDAVAIRDLDVVRRVSLLAAATSGRHMAFEECAGERASSFQVSFPSIPSYETDGELRRAQTSSLTVTSCPSALRVIYDPRFASI